MGEKEGEVVASVARWKEEGAPVGLRWVKLKEAARMYWSEAGKQRGRIQRMKEKWASRRMEQLLWQWSELKECRGEEVEEGWQEA